MNKADPELAAITADADRIAQQLEALKLAPEEQATLARLREGVQHAETEARATEAAALCMVGVR